MRNFRDNPISGRLPRLAIAAATLIMLGGCISLLPGSEVYSLYRNSILDESAKYHIATFDASDGADYNKENCETAAKLFQFQPGVRTRFWCAQGR